MKKEQSQKRYLTEKFAKLRLVLGMLFFSLFVVLLLHPKIATSNEKSTVHPNEHVVKAIALSITPVLFPTSTPIPPTPTPKDVALTPPANTFCINVPVLLYHHTEPYAVAKQEGHAQLTVDSGYFDKQMEYLHDAGYHSISLDDLVAAIQTHQHLPPKSIVVTLDDGYIDNYQYAFPSMKKYGIIGNFAIPTGLIENPDYMNWNQVKELVSNGMHIYNHTWSHASLGGASKEKIIQEITTAGNKIAEITGKKSTILVYPYGSTSPLAIQTLQENGYVAAFTTISGSWQCESNLLRLYRIHIGNAPLSSYGF